MVIKAIYSSYPEQRILIDDIKALRETRGRNQNYTYEKSDKENPISHHQGHNLSEIELLKHVNQELMWVKSPWPMAGRNTK